MMMKMPCVLALRARAAGHRLSPLPPRNAGSAAPSELLLVAAVVVHDVPPADQLQPARKMGARLAATVAGARMLAATVVPIMTTLPVWYWCAWRPPAAGACTTA